MRGLPLALIVTAGLTGFANAQTTPPAAQPTSPAGTSVQIPQDAIMSDQLDDLDVRNAANEKIGEIEDAVISQGRIVGYVISVGGFLGVGDRNIVVDPSAVTLSYNTNDKRWAAAMTATKEQLQAIPEFKYEDRWKD
ncbi:MAG: photosystem reaction center subunit [Microvirga sp.]|jgi:hypothetical protein|nr:photosystem reaction center subunit [Microvirga sp.]